MNPRLLLIAAFLLGACDARREPPLAWEQTSFHDAPEAARFARWLSHYLGAPLPSRAALAAEGERLARLRQEELYRLIALSPQRALELSLPARVRRELPHSLLALLEQRVDAVARFEVLAICSEEEEQIRRYATVGETRYQAFTFGRRLATRSKERLHLHGIAVADRLALSDSPLRRLEEGESARLDSPVMLPPGCSLAQASAYHSGEAIHYLCGEGEAEKLRDALSGHEPSPNPSGPQASPWTTGQKKLLYIRVDFSDAPGEPVTVAQAQQAMGVVNDHYKASSFNKTSLTATITNTLRMPKSKSWYESNSAETQLMQDARNAAAGAGHSLASFDLELIAFQQMPSWGWAGLGYVGQKGSWLNGSFGLRTTAHELGHNLGLYHANFWQAAGETIIGIGQSLEYGNPFEVMGGGTDHFNAWYKFDLDWLLPAEVGTAPAGSSFRIYDLEAFTTGGLKALKVPLGPGKAYWVEFRPQGGGPLQDGASVNWGYAGATQANLLDMTPWTQNAYDSPLAIGRTFEDPNAGIYLTPTGKGGTQPESLDLTVQVGPFAGNLPPTVSLTPSASQVAKGTPVTFTATASDPNGDALAYSWSFGDASGSSNSSTQTRSFSTDREVVAHVTVSDMKGGVAAASTLVRVGNPSGYRISGAVTDAQNGRGVENVRVSGGGRYTWTDSSGGYNLVGVAPGSYTVAAVKPGWTLASAGFTNPVQVGASSVLGVNFQASRATYSIAGRVTSGGAGVAAVTVSAGTYSAVSDSTGNYLLSGVPNGSYLLLAQSAGRKFVPQGFTNPVVVSGANLSGRNFYELVFDISGEVTGEPGPHTVTDGARSTQTVLAGGKWVYTLSKVPPGSWNLWATASGLTLTPSSFTNPVAVISSNLSGKNFQAASGTSYLIRGHLDEAGQPLAGATVSDGQRSGTSDSSGDYLIVAVPPGTFTLTPYRPGYTFTPATRQVTVTTSDSNGNDFSVLNPNGPPTIAVPPHVAQNPITGTSATLTVLGADDDGEQNLHYTWATLFGPAQPSFKRNGDNPAKSNLVTFTKPGGYSFEVTLEDLGGLKVSGTMSLWVAQTPTLLTVSPPSATVELGSERQFLTTLTDQFSAEIDHGGLAEWSASGGGAVNATGKFLAQTPGDFLLTATVQGKSAAAQVKVVVGPVPRVVQPALANPNPVGGDLSQLSVLAEDDEGEEKLVYTWSAISPPAAVSFSPNGTNAAKKSLATFSQEGTYHLQVEVKDTLGLSASDFLTVVVGRGLTRIEISPREATVAPWGTLQLQARGLDQAGGEVSPAPAFQWAASGGGSIDQSGLFTAFEAEGTFTVTASSGLKSASVPVKVVAAQPPLPTPPEKPKGCGCASSDGLLAGLALTGLFFRRRWRRALSLGLVLLASCTDSRLAPNPPSGGSRPSGPAVLRQEVGEVQAGYPSDQERMLHVLTNLARHSPTTPNGNECGDWTSEVGAQVKKQPLVHEQSAAVAARFMARHLPEIGCFQHESCCELGDAGAGTIACLSPGACTGAGCNKTCDAGPGAAPEARYQLFGMSSFSGENISAGQGSAYEAWCALMQSESHRKNIYGDHTQLGPGAYDSPAQSCKGWYWVQGFGSGAVTPSRIPAASAMFRPPNPAHTSALYFAASYFDPSGKAPRRAAVVVNGHCFDLERAFGHEDNGTYEAHFADPDVIPEGCHPYYFLFLDGDDKRHTYPTAGSLQVAIGQNASCPAPYDPSPQKPADCETGQQDCVTGAQRSCYTADLNTLKHGECRQGYQLCRNGFWSACREMIGPFPEACDGVDNDCDGFTDEGNPGGNASCTVSLERGPCKAGKVECISGRHTCVSIRSPQPELCDGVDNDCDGVVDDGFPILSCGKGECFRTAYGCVGGQPGSCTPGTGSPEVADFKDNDCDGVVDDELDCRLPDGGGVARLRQCYSFSQLMPDGGTMSLRLPCKPGQQACQADAGWGTCMGEVGPSPEVCDGTDNDCDGELDETTELGWNRCGAGKCLTYELGCLLGSPRTCTPKPSSAEMCNGLDDNCDGTIDEGCACRETDTRSCYTGRPIHTRDAGVCHPGLRLCIDGGYSACTGEVTPSQEYCNGLDEDCDGQVDDSCLEVPDAGADAGIEADAGTWGEDAGQPDAGQEPPPRKCGCAGAPGSVAFWAALFLLPALRRRVGEPRVERSRLLRRPGAGGR